MQSARSIGVFWMHVKKSGASSEEALLRDDPCGKCFVESCPATLVECCDTAPMGEFVKECAFTADSEKKAACLKIGTTLADAGNVRQYDDAGVQCFKKLAQCFNANCAGKGACNP